MDNFTNKNNLRRSLNPFQEDFSDSTQDISPLAQTFQNINNDKFHQDVLCNEYEFKETALENKMKSLNKSGKISFPSGKNIFRESFRNLGMLPSKNEEYLKLRKMPKITQADFENLKNNIIDKENLKKLLDTLNKVNCNFKSFKSNESVGCILPLTYLIESKFSSNKEKIKEMNDKYNALKPYICNYRSINGDGNCFYRAVMFRYLEILILNEKIESLRNLINDVIISFNSEELKKRTKINNLVIKPDLTFKILILIESLLNDKQKEKAHEILVKSFSTCRKFDYAIILYLRYVLYDYIKKNEKKAYLKSFPIKIGNLLPSQYETNDGQFLFDSFYEYYLLNFYTYGEKIVIYLTPLVLGIELNVIIFDDNEEEILQKFKWEGNSDLGVNDVISLINNKNHYEIFYNWKDNEQYKNIFVNYENNQESRIIANIDKLLKEKEINDNQHFNMLKESVKDLSEKTKEFDSKTMINKKHNMNINEDNNINNANINNQNNYGNKDNNIKNTNNNYHFDNNINANQIRNNNINNQSNNNYHGYRDKNPNYNMNNYQNQEKYLNNEINNNIAYNQIPQGKLNEKNNNDNSNFISLQNKGINYNYNQKSEQSMANKNFANNHNQNNFYNGQLGNQNHNYNQQPEQNMANKNFTNNNNQNNFYNQQPGNQNQSFGLKTPGQNFDSNRPNILQKPSNQNQNDVIIGLKTPGQNINKNICMSCKKIEIDNNNINICKFCFRTKLLNELYSSYLEYIKNIQNTRFNGRIELKLRNNENQKIYSLDEAIEEYNKNYKNEYLNYQEVINELKKRVCVFCQDELKNESIKIPCNCHFCSKGHLELFLKKYNFYKDFVCYCLKKYSREMMFNLGILCNDLDIPSKNSIKLYFNNKLNFICCICGKTSNITMYSENLKSLHNPNQRSINSFLSLLIHYFCGSCGANYRNSEFFCQICKMNHFYNDIYYIQKYYS